MNSLISRGSILLITRFTNTVLQLISPIILVRLFDLNSYGQYQKFNLYALIFLNLFSFGISSNLLYFLNKYPKKLSVLVSHTCGLLFFASIIGIIAAYALNDFIFSKDSINYLLPLIVLIFFQLNMAFWDVFWIALKKPYYVLCYSTTINFIKIFGLIAIAYLTINVVYVIWWLCIVQVCRFIFVIINAVKRKWLTFNYEKLIMKEQIKYFYPIGTTSSIRSLNDKLGSMFIAQTLGLEALALYSIGSRNIPVIPLVRSSIVDTVFPEIVERGTQSDDKAILLWQKANVIITGAIFPFFIAGVFYAKEIISTIFTNQYLEAVPIFRIYLFLMIVQSFEFTLPIRNKNKNFHIIIAGAVRFACNFILIYVLFEYFGILGPAIAAVVSGFIESIYLGFIVYRLYSKKLKNLLMWKKEIIIFAVSLIGLFILWVGKQVLGENIISIFFNVAIFFSIYTIFLWKLDVDEFKVLLKWCREKIRLFYSKCLNFSA